MRSICTLSDGQGRFKRSGGRSLPHWEGALDAGIGAGSDKTSDNSCSPEPAGPAGYGPVPAPR